MTRIVRGMLLSLLLSVGLLGGCESLGDFADDVDLDDLIEDVQIDVDDDDQDKFDHGGGGQYEVGYARGESEGYWTGFAYGASASPDDFELFVPLGNIEWQAGYEDGFWTGFDEGYEDGFEEYLAYRP